MDKYITLASCVSYKQLSNILQYKSITLPGARININLKQNTHLLNLIIHIIHQKLYIDNLKVNYKNTCSISNNHRYHNTYYHYYLHNNKLYCHECISKIVKFSKIIATNIGKNTLYVKQQKYILLVALTHYLDIDIINTIGKYLLWL